MKRYLVLDLEDGSGIQHAWRCSPSEIDRRTGRNTGNFAFRYSILNFLVQGELVVGGFSRLDNTDGFDAVLLACSNWIGSTPNHERANRNRFESLANTTVPVIALGLGTQLSYGQGKAALGEWTLKFLQRLAERSPAVSVRDEFTAELLSSVGFGAVHATGCPSNFISPSTTLGSQLRDKVDRLLQAQSSWDELFTLVQEYSGPNAFGSAVFSSHVQTLARAPSAYVVQDMPLISALLNSPFVLPPEYEPDKFPAIPVELVPGYPRLLRQKSMFFTDFSEWMQFARRADLSFGMRLHGNMAALQSGVPSLVVTHDLRTAELTRHMGMPNVSAKEYLQMDLASPSAILSHLRGFLGEFDARRSTLAADMLALLNRCGVSPSQQLESLAQAPLAGPTPPAA